MLISLSPVWSTASPLAILLLRPVEVLQAFLPDRKWSSISSKLRRAVSGTHQNIKIQITTVIPRGDERTDKGKNPQKVTYQNRNNRH